MDARDIQRLVDEADAAALLRAVDGLCASRDWDLLELLGQRCRQAVEYGHQLWGVSMHADYRLAWEGSAEHAARAVERGSSRFTLGPLTEVAASTHDWAALGAHLRDDIVRTTVAQERVLRGEDLRAQGLTGAQLPLALAGWEPDYALPAYRDRDAKFPAPQAAVRHVPLRDEPPAAPEPFEDEATEALRDLVRPWWTESSGTADAVGVEGDAQAAVAALRAGRPGPLGLLPLEPTQAMALLQWAGANGGAHGRRPGGAAGRFAAWWAAAALAGLDWPPGGAKEDFGDELGQALSAMRWHRWACPDPDTGWTLRLAVALPTEGIAYALEALDRKDDDEEDAADETKEGGWGVPGGS